MAKKDELINKEYLKKIIDKSINKQIKTDSFVNKTKSMILEKTKNSLFNNYIINDVIKKQKEFKILFEKIDRIYTVRNIVNYILLTKENQFIKTILNFNLFLLLILIISIIPNVFLTLKEPTNILILLIHSSLTYFYYYIFKNYIINSYFYMDLYKYNISDLFNKNEVILIEELIKLYKKPILSKFKREYFLNSIKNNEKS